MTDEELENLDLIIERQVEFVEWLKERGMYNPMETAETMQKMHRVWLESSRSLGCSISDAELADVPILARG